jgi:radical SAM protein with 4Fe4S-binding SPASM domain
MEIETFTRIIDELHPFVRHLNLFYLGEPMLCDHLDRMILYAGQHRMRVSVSSNLNIFDEEKAERLIESRLDQLIVSLDGASQESYEAYRKGGDFNKVIDHIRLLLEKKRKMQSPYPQITLQFVIFKNNEKDIPKMKALAKRLGVDLFFRQGALGGKGLSPPLTKDSTVAEKWLSRTKKYQTEYDYFSEKPYLKDGICEYLWKVATINWDGSVFPCCWVYQNQHSFGNITEQSFRTIWNNELFSSSRSLFNKKKRGSSQTEIHTKETICYQCKMFKHVTNVPC